MSRCPTCGHDDGHLPMDEYQARALPRLAEIDWLDKRIDWSLSYPTDSEDERRRERRAKLMREQMADEVAAGL